MRSYRVFLSLEAMEALRVMRPAQRRQVADFVETLKGAPFQEGDYSEKDETDRPIEIKIIGQYAITFWADSPVDEVKVTDIERADGF